MLCSKNLRKFRASLENADLCNVKNQDNPDNCFKNLHDLLIEEFDKFIPLKESSKITKHSEWYDRELRRLTLKKDRLYKKYFLRRDLTSKNQYHKIRNMYFHLIQLNKIEFYQKKKIVKKTWQYINSLLGRTSLNSATSSFFINGKKTCDSALIANEFND